VISMLKKYAAEIGNLGHVCDSGWCAFLGTAVAETALNTGGFGAGTIVENHRINLFRTWFNFDAKAFLDDGRVASTGWFVIIRSRRSYDGTETGH
jgi:hypothetical protein